MPEKESPQRHKVPTSDDGLFRYGSLQDAAGAALELLHDEASKYVKTAEQAAILSHVTAMLETQAGGNLEQGTRSISDGLIRFAAAGDAEAPMPAIYQALSIVGYYGLSVDGFDLMAHRREGHSSFRDQLGR